MKIGPYEVLETIGWGGFGAVHRARSAEGRIVAIKTVHDPLRRHVLERFHRERRLQGSLGEPEGFVPLIDAGTDPDKGPFLVMPFVSGGTLRARLSKGRLETEEAIAIGRALARAMALAHERGIVHRDLKPENILFTSDMRPLIADLGLAKHFLADAPGASQSIAITQPGEMKGTPGFMPPEQARSTRDAGPAADVFALGAIIYECLSGEPAFRGDHVLELLARVESGDRTPLREACPEAPRAIEEAVERALSPDPGKRFPDARAFSLAIEPRAPGQRTWRRALVGASATLAILVLATAFFLSREKEPDAAPTPSPVAPTPTASVAKAEPFIDAVAQRKLALDLEQKRDRRGALEAWSRILDSTPAGPEARREARDHMAELIRALPQNRDPAKAAVVWRVKVLVFRRTRCEQTDVFGTKRTIDLTVSPEDERAIERNVTAWAELVFADTRGLVRVEREIVPVAAPVTHFDKDKIMGIDVFDVQASKLPFDFDKKLGNVDAWLAYVGMGPREGDHLERVHFSQLGFGSESSQTGTSWGVISFYDHELMGGEGGGGVTEHRMWLEHVEHVFSEVQGWPATFFPAELRLWPDRPPDPDLPHQKRPAPEECPDCPRAGPDAASRLRLSRHLCQLHATERLWRSLSTRIQERNAWNAGDVHRYRVAGPFDWGADDQQAALERPLASLDGHDLPTKGTLVVEGKTRELRFDREVFAGADVAHKILVAQCLVRAPSAVSAYLWLGSDDGVRVTLDDKLVGLVAASRHCTPDQDLFPIELHSGWNRLQVRLANLNGPWSLSVRILGKDGRPIPGLELAVDRPGE